MSTLGVPVFVTYEITILTDEIKIFFLADTCMVRSGYRLKYDVHLVFFPFDYYMREHIVF